MIMQKILKYIWINNSRFLYVGMCLWCCFSVRFHAFLFTSFHYMLTYTHGNIILSTYISIMLSNTHTHSQEEIHILNEHKLCTFSLLCDRESVRYVSMVDSTFSHHQCNTRAWKFDLQTKLGWRFYTASVPEFAYICSSSFIPSSYECFYLFCIFLFINTIVKLRLSCSWNIK